ncbi:MAG: DUF2141 domain-containing protein [Myxococcota bacterium]
MMFWLLSSLGFASSGLDVVITGLHSAQGRVGCSAFADESGWPGDPTAAKAAMLVDIRGDRAVCRFTELPAGRYAIAVMHDENNNQKLDTNTFGFPAEGYGFSRDAPIRFGPPSFDSAAVDYAGDDAQITVRIRY